MIGKAIYDILSNDGTVSGIVGTRIYPDRVPQEAAFPYVAYTLVSTLPTDYKDGASSLDVATVQIDIYAQDYSTTQDLSAACRSALDRYSGTNNGVKVDKVIFVNEGAGDYNKQLNVFWASQDYNIRIKR